MTNGKFNLCYPYGSGVSCICDGRSRIFKCFPSFDSLNSGPKASGDLDLTGEAMLRGDDRNDPNGILSGEEFNAMDGFGGQIASRRRGVFDERTEIILAATFLVLIILAFIR